jgi:4-aminobutyrate aminotransferase/(S)-3-amino-2-methylpropionate transaminase
MTRAIHLQTEIPGPRSRDIVARRDAAMPSGAARLTPIAVASAHGAVVTDVDGNRYLDFAGGIGTLALGHTPTAVVEAVQQQAGQLLHMCAIVASYEPLVAVAERLNALAPGDVPRRTLLMNSGAEAVERRCTSAAATRSGRRSWCSTGPTTGAPT